MVAFIYPRLADKSLTVLPAPQGGYDTVRDHSLSVQFGIDFFRRPAVIRFLVFLRKKVVYRLAIAASKRIFQLDKFVGMLIAMPLQMSFHPALTGDNGICVRKI